MKLPRPIVIDFETDKIEGRPKYPPRPVGVSIKFPGKKCKYYAWGHPTENNCSREDAQSILQTAWRSNDPLLFHNAKFDIDVAQTFMGVGDIHLDPLRVHDTQFLLFLVDPHAWNLGLKPSAEKWLNMPPTEQQDVFRWLKDHEKQLKAEGLIPPNIRITEGNAGAYICLAPGRLVGKYADGDVERTEKLFQKLYPMVVEEGMLPAYQRELKLIPILLENERHGIRCDLAGLEKADIVYTKAMGDVETWLRKRLKKPTLDFNKDIQLADALDDAGVVTEWTYTPKSGQKSMNKNNLKPHHYHDQKVFRALGYRNKLETCLSTYIHPWLEVARETDGLLFPGWNQTRNDKDTGTRTGRLSSSPNFMAVAKSFEDKGDGWTHPEFIKVLPPLPLMRSYILPDAPGHVWGRRDFNQQEVRILAHFEDDLLMQAYLENPLLDVHSFVQQAIRELLGLDLPRTPIKTLNFGLIYGQGVGSMAEKLGKMVEEVRAMRNAQLTALPGLKELETEIKKAGKQGRPVTTWGGRKYYAEDPKLIDGRWRTFEYKLLNYLIQGTGADVTKESIIRWHSLDNRDSRFVLTVHDENNISSPKKAFKREMARLREVMLSVELDVPMLSDGEFGPNWGSMEKFKEPAFKMSDWRR